MSRSLDPIFDWEMTEIEAKVYKVAVLWEKLTQKYLPGYMSAGKLPKKSDPRKSNLFRHCWKMVRETRGLLEEKDYQNYLIAQIIIIKAHKGYIAANAMCGDKAWVRWKVWEHLYKKKIAEKNIDAPEIDRKAVNPKIIKGIAKTKKFLFEHFKNQPTLDDIMKLAKSKLLFYVQSGKISYYYIVLSPWIKQTIVDMNSYFHVDLKIYEDHLDDAVKHFFNKEFNYEFEFM